MLGVLEKGILRRRKLCREPVLCSWTLLCGSWMPATISPAVNLLWDPCGVHVRVRKGKSLSLLDLCVLELSRFTAALTCCSFLSTEYALSVQFCVRCLGKSLCDSLEFLDVSNASPAMKKTFLVFFNGVFA